jgi:hypothetical protein
LSAALAVVLLVAGDRALHLTPRWEGANIRFYVLQLRNALIALPLFLLWLRLSKRPALLTLVRKLERWWLGSRFTVLAALLFFVALTTAVANWAYHRIPLVDAIWVMFQTKIFAAGRLYAPAPAYPEFFRARWIIHGDRWFSYVSPGHSLVVLPGYLLGVSWLVGPLLGTLAVWLFYRLTEAVAGWKTARLALLLAITSPFLVFLFASHEFHVASTLFTILTLFLLSRPRAGSVTLLGAGMSLGMVFLARPYTAVGVGVPLVFFVASRRVALRLRRHLIPFLLGGAAFVVLHLVYNQALTGNALVFPYMEMGKVHAIGFGGDFGEPGFGVYGHTPARALVNLAYGVFVLCLQLSGWLFLSLIFVIPGISTQRFRRNWWLGLSAAGLIAAYFFYWCHGMTAWGAKYWSEAVPAFLLLSALGIRAAGRGKQGHHPKRVASLFSWFRFRRDLPVRAVGFLIAYSLLVHIPVNFSYLARCQWGETPKVGRRVRRAGLHNALVFVHTDEESGSFDYSSAFLLNDPLLKGDVIYARDLGPEENLRLVRLYPERRAYVYDFNQDSIRPGAMRPQMDTDGRNHR